MTSTLKRIRGTLWWPPLPDLEGTYIGHLPPVYRGLYVAYITWPRPAPVWWVDVAPIDYSYLLCAPLIYNFQSIGRITIKGFPHLEPLVFSHAAHIAVCVFDVTKFVPCCACSQFSVINENIPCFSCSRKIGSTSSEIRPMLAGHISFPRSLYSFTIYIFWVLNLNLTYHDN